MRSCTPAMPCRESRCPFCDPVGYAESGAWAPDPAEEPEPLYADLAALLSGGIPPPTPPVVLRRSDGTHMLYAGKVNVLFGDPESGKTWLALAAVVETLRQGRRAAVVDLDHNGAAATVTRLLALGARPETLASQDRLRYASPEDVDTLVRVVHDLRRWAPAVVVVDSLGELLPMLGLSSNSPDDYTAAHRRVLIPPAEAGACVIAIDHLPKGGEARAHGQTGTMAKRRAVNGAIIRVSLRQAFAPGRGGSAGLTVVKDRPGGLRATCPAGAGEQLGGIFTMEALPEGGLAWTIDVARAAPAGRDDADVAELDALLPAPRSQRDVQERLGWGGSRAMNALRKWRELRERPADDAL